jgi:uncharacterized protein (DUF1778 family)
MARPPKDRSLLMNIPLRLMLTADQKELIDRAARLEKLEISAWARPLLLQAAQEVIAKAEMRDPKRGRQR